MKQLRLAMVVFLGSAALSISGCGNTAEKPEFVFDRARLLVGRGHYDEALDLMEKLPAEYESDAECCFEKGKCFEAVQDLDAALKQYEAVLKLDPESPDAINNKGSVLAKMGRYKDAAQQFSLLIEKFPNEILAYRNRGLCYHDLKQYDDALNDYNQGLALKSDEGQADLTTLFQRGNLFMQLKRYEEAVNDYSQVIGRDDAHAGAWMNRGIARFRTGLRKEGMADLLEAQARNENIAIPDLNWMEAAPAASSQTVITAKPAFDPDSWAAAKQQVQTFLTDNGYADVALSSENESTFCGRWDSSVNGKPTTVLVGRNQSSVIVPNVSGSNGRHDLILLSFADGKFQFTQHAEWQPASAAPVLIQVAAPE